MNLVTKVLQSGTSKVSYEAPLKAQYNYIMATQNFLLYKRSQKNAVSGAKFDTFGGFKTVQYLKHLFYFLV